MSTSLGDQGSQVRVLSPRDAAKDGMNCLCGRLLQLASPAVAYAPHKSSVNVGHELVTFVFFLFFFLAPMPNACAAGPVGSL